MTADKAAARQRAERRASLERGMLACYEVIDMARKELAELDAAEKAASLPPPPSIKEDDKL